VTAQLVLVQADLTAHDEIAERQVFRFVVVARQGQRGEQADDEIADEETHEQRRLAR
jgi:hypothetical protein